MKKMALMALALSTCVWSAETQTIQVISAQKESSITPAFQKKVQQTGLKSVKKKEGDRYVVTVGVFKDKAEAKKTIGKVRDKVTCDAFVRPVDRVMTVKAESSKSEPIKAVAAPVKTEVIAMVAKAVEEPKKENVTVPEKVEVVAKAVEKASENNTVKPEVQVQPAMVATVTPKAEAAPKREATFVLFDNKALYKNDIAEAIQYYKTSPYHRFEPSGLKR